MKKYIKYLLAILFLPLAFSCSDFLEEEVFDMKTSNNFWQKPEDAELAMVGTYKYLADTYRQSLIEMLTQNSGAFNKRKASTVWISGSYTSATKEIYQTWEGFFRLIDKSNDVIANVSKMDVLTDEEKSAIIGEARFLRGWSYFMLVRMYTKAPIKLEPTTGFDNAYAPLSTADEIYSTVIIPDFEYAFNNCQAKQPASNTGRITKGAAAAALAKVHLTIAGNTSGSEHWKEARDWAKWVIDNGGYSLVNDFSQLWGTKNTSESVFEVQFLRGVLTGSGYSKIFTPAKSGWSAKGGGWGRSTCTQKNYDDFAKQYKGDYRIDVTFTASYNDIRNGKSIPVYPTKKYNKKQNSWPYIAKWKDPDAPDNFAADNNFIVIRYADVLLMFAEAENEVNGPTGEAYDAIDQILARARAADGTEREVPANWTRDLSQKDFSEKVWNERRYELCAEQHLWFDLVRKGKDKFIAFKEADNAHGYKLIDHGVYAKNMYFPIPTLEISSNPMISVEEQNEGY